MEPEVLQAYLDQEPFRPLTVLTSGGERYEVSSPASAWVRPTRIFIALPPDPTPYPKRTDKVVQLALSHGVGVEEQQDMTHGHALTRLAEWLCHGVALPTG